MLDMMARLHLCKSLRPPDEDKWDEDTMFTSVVRQPHHDQVVIGVQLRCLDSKVL